MERGTSPEPRRWNDLIAWAVDSAALLLVAAGLLALFLAAGCQSHTKQIADGAMRAGRESTEIVQHAEATKADLDAPPPEVPATPETVAWLGRMVSNQLAIINKAQSINKTATSIVQQVPHVEDKVPWWASLLKLFAVLGIIAAALYFFVASGAFKVVRGIVWGFGLLIPARAMTAAKFDFEYHQKNPDDAQHREAVAANRGKDPAYDAAWKKYKAESAGGAA